MEILAHQALSIRYKTQLAFAQIDAFDRYLADGDAAACLRGRSALIDTLLGELHQHFSLPENIAIIGVGGYGRGELCPASDIDLLFLLNAPPADELAENLAKFVQLLWDLGLKVGHSVRTLDECLREATIDLTVQTALVEARLICGNAALCNSLLERFKGTLNIQTFFHAKRMEQEVRYLRFNDSPNNLEPNCKESPGGLRDLQTILWIAQAAGFGGNWQELKERGFITHSEEQGLIRHENFLQGLRIRLHQHAQRQEDRLLFDYQTLLAHQLGFNDTPIRRASEQLMQSYYRTAKIVMQLNTILLQNMAAVIFPQAVHAPQVLNASFQSRHQLLDVTHENVFNDAPEAIFEVFLLLQAHSEFKGISARTMRALWRARKLVDAKFRANPHNQRNFMAILKAPRGVLREMRRMNQFDILGRYLPAFGEIVGQMQHDLFHVYTVDQHILLVLRNLRRFSEDEFAHEYPFCSQLISDFDKPWRLYVAALFHDIAKGRNGDHSQLGALDAHAFCHQHGLSDEDSELIAWLVRNHLVMSQVAQKQDIADPDIIAAFAALVGDQTHLIALYLLSIADIRATSQKVWNSWKGQLLERLFLATQRTLQAGGQPPARHGLIQERQDEAQKLLHMLPATSYQAFWQELDTVYFLRHSGDEIAWHTHELHHQQHSDTPIVKAREVAGKRLEVMVYTVDQSALFMRIVAFLSRSGFNILDAKIHTTRSNYALDSFVIQDLSNRDNDLVAEIEHGLDECLHQQNDVEIPFSGRQSRQVRHFPIAPEITIIPDDKGTHFILSVSATDRPGLLYTVAKLLNEHQACLHTARISTLGERVEDTFLISGNNFHDATIRMQLESDLLAELK